MQNLAAAEPWLLGVMAVAMIGAMIWIRKDQKRQIRRALRSTETSLKEHSRREAEVLTRSARRICRFESLRIHIMAPITATAMTPNNQGSAAAKFCIES